MANEQIPADVNVSEQEVLDKLAQMDKIKQDQVADLQSSSKLDIEPTEEELAQKISEMQKYGDRGLETAAVSGAGLLTLGATNKLLEAMDSERYSPEQIRKLREYNPGWATTGELGGVVAASLLTGGGAAAGAAGARGAGAAALRGAAQVAKRTAGGIAETAGAVAERAVLGAIKESASKTAAREILRKSAGMMARGATDGAILGFADLANEASIGEAEFNAQNLLGYVGGNAFAGGLAGAVIPVGGAAFKGAATGGKKLFDKTITKYADPTKDMMSLLGMSEKKIIDRLSDTSEKGKNFVSGLLPWVQKRVGVENIKTDEALYSTIVSLNKRAQATADEVLEAVDQQLPRQPGLLNRRQRIFETMAENAQRMIEKQEAYGLDSAIYKKLQQKRNMYMQRAQEGLSIRPTDLREFRKMEDEYINWARKNAEHTELERLAKENRSLLNDEMYDLVNTVDPSKAKVLKQSMEDMKYSISLMDDLGSKVAKGGGSIVPNAMEVLQAAGMVHLGGTIGGATALGAKFLKSDMKRRLNVMIALKKANDATKEKTVSAVKNFMKSKTGGGKIVVNTPLLVSAFAVSQNKEKPKNKQEAYKNIAQNLADYTNDPQKLLDKAVSATAAIGREAPQTAEAATQSMINMVQFLQSKVPKNPYMEQMPGVKPREYTPSSMELAKFNRYLQIAEQPLTVLHELENGTLTQDHVEALKAVYPATYTFIRSTMMQEMQDSGSVNLTYAQKMQASILLDIISDSSMTGANIAALQQNFSVNEQPDGSVQPVVQPTQGGTGNINQAERSATETQSFIQRRNSR